MKSAASMMEVFPLALWPTTATVRTLELSVPMANSPASGLSWFELPNYTYEKIFSEKFSEASKRKTVVAARAEGGPRSTPAATTNLAIWGHRQMHPVLPSDSATSRDRHCLNLHALAKAFGQDILQLWFSIWTAPRWSGTNRPAPTRGTNARPPTSSSAPGLAAVPMRSKPL